MYVDKKSHTLLRTVCIILAAALVVSVFLVYRVKISGDMSSEAEYAIRETIRRSAVQCFAVEGVYPESLGYLEDNYGLRVNTDDYYVVYEVFAENLPPNIRVAKKEG